MTLKMCFLLSGMMLLPKVQETVQQLFAQAPSKFVNLDADVAIYRSSHADRVLHWLAMSHTLFS